MLTLETNSSLTIDEMAQAESEMMDVLERVGLHPQASTDSMAQYGLRLLNEVRMTRSLGSRHDLKNKIAGGLAANPAIVQMVGGRVGVDVDDFAAKIEAMTEAVYPEKNAAVLIIYARSSDSDVLYFYLPSVDPINLEKLNGLQDVYPCDAENEGVDFSDEVKARLEWLRKMLFDKDVVDGWCDLAVELHRWSPRRVDAIIRTGGF